MLYNAKGNNLLPGPPLRIRACFRANKPPFWPSCDILRIMAGLGEGLRKVPVA